MSLILPDPELQIIIRKLVKENIKSNEYYLKTIKDWMIQQPHLPNTWDDVRLMNCLRSCSFSLEKCKTKIDNYFSTKTFLPELYSNRVYAKNQALRKVCSLVSHAVLPGLTSNGRRISCYRINSESDGWLIEDNFKFTFMLYDLLLGLDLNGASGEIFVIDSSTMSTSVVSQFTTDFVRKTVFAMFDAYPKKVKQIHVINSNPIIHKLFDFIKMFMKKKIKNRIYMHGSNIESLYEYIPQELLPEEYGGNAGKLTDLHDAWIEKLKEWEPWFEEQESVKTDESKRPGKPKTPEDLFGIEEKLANLDID